MNTDFIKCPCDDCTAEHKLIDEYGYFCDIVCHERSYWIARKQGADAMLEALVNNPDKNYVQYVPEGFTNTQWPVLFKKSGHMVFIPED